MTRKNIFSARNPEARHFRLVHRPPGEESGAAEGPVTFEDMFVEYQPQGKLEALAKAGKVNPKTRTPARVHHEQLEDDDDEMVDLDDLDAELDKYAVVDIEGEDDFEHVKPIRNEAQVGEAAKYGILFDDRGYDYTKHLRSVGVTPGAVLINAPGTKKTAEPVKKNTLFFEDEKETVQVPEEQAENEEDVIDPVLVEANELAKKEYRDLLLKASNDPTLKEVLEALEDDRYVVEDVEDDLVLNLDRMSLQEDLQYDEEFEREFDQEEFEYEEEEIDIMGEDDDDFDAVMREYDEDDESYEESNYQDYKYDDQEVDIEQLDEEEAAAMLQYLREAGKARKSTLYERRRSPYLPPLHIAIAQYDEVRRDLSVNKDFIISRYAEKDEEKLKMEEEQIEKELESMFEHYDRDGENKKHLNIETAKWYISETVPIVEPETIVEKSTKKRSSKKEVEPKPVAVKEKAKVDTSKARPTDETLEEKKARKAQIKAEKREKRAQKSTKA